MAPTAIFEWKLIVALGIMAGIADVGRGSGRLIKTSNYCTCPGDILDYNCNITGSGFTIWRGSAFDCPNVDGDSRIRLRHSSFGSGTTGLCNDGAIIGQSLGISTDSSNNPVFMSQLTINLTATSHVLGQTVECVYLDPNGVETVIGSTTIEITDPPSPPTNIQLVSVSPRQLIFNWTTVDSNCSTLQYNVISNCGTCLGVMEKTVTFVTCSIDLSAVSNNMLLCSFGISSVICGNISGISSTPREVVLKVPQSPTIINATPRYDQGDSTLIGLNIKFNEVEAFMISNGVDGSALHYTISYTDSSTGDICDTLIISASSCVQRICTVPSIDPLPCSERAGNGDIVISISANNLLGRGPPSVTTIGQTNRYVNVTLEMTNKIVCTFLSQQESRNTLSCDVAYGPCQQQLTMIAQGTISSPNTVNIDIPAISQTSDYCYAVNASNGTYTLIIEGLTSSLMTEPGDGRQSNQVSVAAAVTVPVLLLIGVLAAAIVLLLIFIYKKWQQAKIKDMETGIEERLLSDHSEIDDELQSVPVHICFDLEDKPQELLNALEKIKKLQINFKNIKIGPCELIETEMDNKAEESPDSMFHLGLCAISSRRQVTLSVRKIYIQCQDDITETQKEEILKLKISSVDTLKVFCTAETQEYKKDVDTKQTFEITEVLVHEPGALLSLLRMIYSVEACKHINITNINIRNLQNGTEKCVTITFLPHMARNWKEKYNKKRYRCKSISKPANVESISSKV